MVNEEPARPEPGTDSTVDDWFGQSVNEDTELAEELSEALPMDEAERAFEERAEGEERNALATVSGSIQSRVRRPTASAARESSGLARSPCDPSSCRVMTLFQPAAR